MTRLFILIRSLVSGRRSANLEQLAEETAGFVPNLPALERQLLASVAYLEKSVVEVCAGFEGMANRARESAELASRMQSGEGSDIGALITASRRTLDELVEQIKRGAAVSSLAVERMQAVDRASRQILQALAEAERIAFVNKLLALNAKIEAVHVGELGSSFAVVADEIAQQAEHANRVTGRILALMTDLGRTAGLAAHDLDEMASVSQETLEASRGGVESALTRLTHTHEQMQRSLVASVSQGQAVTEEVARAVMALQFQDRVNQRVNHVVDALGAMRQSIAQPLEAIRRETPWIGAERSRQMAAQLEDTCTMNAERDVLHARAAARENEGDDIELFV